MKKSYGSRRRSPGHASAGFGLVLAAHGPLRFSRTIGNLGGPGERDGLPISGPLKGLTSIERPHDEHRRFPSVKLAIRVLDRPVRRAKDCRRRNR